MANTVRKCWKYIATVEFFFTSVFVKLLLRPGLTRSTFYTLYIWLKSSFSLLLPPLILIQVSGKKCHLSSKYSIPLLKDHYSQQTQEQISVHYEYNVGRLINSKALLRWTVRNPLVRAMESFDIFTSMKTALTSSAGKNCVSRPWVGIVLSNTYVAFRLKKDLENWERLT